jgi:hypothetical protein
LILAALLLAIPSTGTFHLPAGVTEVSAEIKIPDGARHLTIIGDGSTLRAAPNYHGRAIISCRGCRDLAFRNFAIEGNRDGLSRLLPLPPADRSFASFFPNNGILIEETQGFSTDHLNFTHIAGFAILVNHSSNVLIDHLSVRDSGSLNAKGRNNTTGGVLLEDGVDDFTVADSVFANIRGNGVWTHSRYSAPRSSNGKIAKVSFSEIGRDAIQIGHATQVEVTGNQGTRIGFPAAVVDVENGGTPVGIDTAGNVDHATYELNRFEEVDGKCFDLDGFHDGAVRGNTCTNPGPASDYPYGNFGIAFNNTNPDMQSKNVVIEGNEISGTYMGAMFVLGEGHVIRNNRLLRLDQGHCSERPGTYGCYGPAGEPGFLESGIYLAKGGERPAPAHNITIENNIITGRHMAAHCIEAAPGVKLSDNTIRNNSCSDE